MGPQMGPKMGHKQKMGPQMGPKMGLKQKMGPQMGPKWAPNKKWVPKWDPKWAPNKKWVPKWHPNGPQTNNLDMGHAHPGHGTCPLPLDQGHAQPMGPNGPGSDKWARTAQGPTMMLAPLFGPSCNLELSAQCELELHQACSAMRTACENL